MTAPAFPHGGWAASWPRDSAAVAGALAVAAAFPDLVGTLQIHLEGNAEEALETLIDILAAHGVADSDLPDVGLVPAAEPQPGRPRIDEMPRALAASLEYQRRPWLPAFPSGDESSAEVWPVMARALESHPGATASVITDTLEGADRVRTPSDVTVVTSCPGGRRRARRAGFAAVPRPPSDRHLPDSTFLVLDARRPDDLVLAGTAGHETILVNAEGVSNLAIEALGVAADRVWNALTAAPVGT